MKKLMRWAVGLQLVALASAAGAADLVLGATDVVKLSVFGNPELGVETRVSDWGAITVPLIGQVMVAGLSSSAAEKLVASKLEQGGFVKNPQVNLLVTVLNSQQVSVLGQVTRPGRFPLEGQRNVLEMLAQAGGIAPDGGETVVLMRNKDGKSTREVIDVIGVVHDGEVQRNIDVQGGDVLYVERAPRVYIYGEVQRPGPFRLERGMTVVQALSSICCERFR